MSNSTTEPFETGTEGERPLPAVISDRALQAFESMIQSVPEAGQDGAMRILEQVMEADDVRQLDQPWKAEGLKAYANARLRFLSIERAESDFEEGLGWFLIVRAVVVATGEQITTTTSSVGTVAQLVKAWQLGAFPFEATPVFAERPSKRGFLPMHLQLDKG